MSESPLAKKMKLKPGLRAAVLNAPENHLNELQHDSEIAQKPSGKFDWIQIFAKNKNEHWSAFALRPYKEGEKKQSFQLGA